MRTPNKFFKCCIDCQDRRVGCHAKCPKYNEDKKGWYRLNNSIRDGEKTTKKTATVYVYRNHRGQYISKVIATSKA